MAPLLSQPSTLLLIELFKDEPCLWDFNIENYNKKNKRAAALERIIKTMEENNEKLSETEVKSLINNLRTQYRRELLKVNKSKTSGKGTDDIYKPKWKYYVHLEFLQPVTVQRTTVSNLQQSQESSEEEGSEVEIDGDEDEDGSQETSDSFSTVPSTPGETPKASRGSGKRIFEDQNTGARKAASRLKEKSNCRAKAEDLLLKEAALALKSAVSTDKAKEETDQDLLYGKWLGGELKQITDPRTKQLIKIKIQNLLFEAQFGEPAPQSFRPATPTPNLATMPSTQSLQTPSNLPHNQGTQNWQNNHMMGFQGPSYTHL